MPNYVFEVLVEEGLEGFLLDPNYVLLELLIDLNPNNEVQIRRVMLRAKSQFNPALGLRRELLLAVADQGERGVVERMMLPLLDNVLKVKGAHTFTLLEVLN